MLQLTLLTLLVGVLAQPPVDYASKFCKEKGPGLFSKGCSGNVTVCNKFGKELYLLCPFGLVFDDSIEECRDQKLVAECESKKVKSTGRSLDGLPTSLCEKSPDGFHAATDCSTSVVQCTGGVPGLLECPTGQVFDNTKNVCAAPEDIPACRPVADTPAAAVSNECEGLADGMFEKEPCSSFFLTCSGGVSRIMSCPSNLVFDKKLNICEYPGNVEGCSTLPPATNTTSEICAEDGFFSYGNCSDLFYACSNGRQIPMYCPAKLAFDQTRQLCDYPLAVASCLPEEGSGEDSDETSGEGSGDSSESYEDYSGDDQYDEASGGLDQDASEASGESSGKAEEGSSAKMEEDVPLVESWDSNLEESSGATAAPESPANFCESKPDGFYAAGCSSEMIACVAGEPTVMLCPAHLIFDEKKQICEYPENVPCFTSQQQAQDGEKSEKCNVNGPLSDGICSSTFINCVDGEAFHLVCDDGYAFSETHGSCVEKTKLRECYDASQKK
ncbi:unnamed protein product [Nippostrongylus brasiliensis]|uniref:Chondroitin proteoglycan 1 (inferred by orthology to a C. elegans protein) n=1 Tax=Nippostrongylus brasiliensis TaxID=27835 RepID=A0A0N4XUX9_NIPBR|nr:unnamed protein product [Nippostrongylus brasiliensis]